MVLSAIVPTWFYDKIESESQIFHKHTINYLWFNAIFSLFLCFPTILLMREKPKYPPSNSEFKKVSPGFVESIKLLFRNKSFIFLLINTCGTIGYTNVYATIIAEMLDHYNVSALEASIISFIMSSTGFLLSLVVGFILDKTKAYKKSFVIMTLSGLIFHIAWTLSLEIFTDYGYICSLFLYVMANIFTTPIYCICLDYCCELTYPVGKVKI